jgi:hypothetical protein
MWQLRAGAHSTRCLGGWAARAPWHGGAAWRSAAGAAGPRPGVRAPGGTRPRCLAGTLPRTKLRYHGAHRPARGEWLVWGLIAARKGFGGVASRRPTQQGAAERAARAGVCAAGPMVEPPRFRWVGAAWVIAAQGITGYSESSARRQRLPAAPALQACREGRACRPVGTAGGREKGRGRCSDRAMVHNWCVWCG